MTHLMKLDETLNAGRDTCAVVGSAAEMAAVLARASPSKARGFAVAMHERACDACDEAALAFWRNVLASLALGGDAPRATLMTIRTENLIGDGGSLAPASLERRQVDQLPTKTGREAHTMAGTNFIPYRRPWQSAGIEPMSAREAACRLAICAAVVLAPLGLLMGFAALGTAVPVLEVGAGP